MNGDLDLDLFSVFLCCVNRRQKETSSRLLRFPSFLPFLSALMGIQQLSQVTIRSISSGPVITGISSIVKELVEYKSSMTFQS